MDNNVSFVKKVTTKVVGSSNEELLTDDIYASLSKANQLLVVLAETYTDVTVMVVKYANGYGLSSTTLDGIKTAMEL